MSVNQLTIEGLADEVDRLEHLIATALAEAQSYRALARSAIHLLHEQRTRIKRQDETITHLREQLRDARKAAAA